MKTVREFLGEAYLDFRNNYLTIEKYAEHNGLKVEDATAFMGIAEQIFDSPHPEV